MVCMHEKNHSNKELANYIAREINSFLRIKTVEKAKVELSALATRSLLYEISLSPKPGLVDKFGTGAHKDMDFFSFLSSTSALTNYWGQLVGLANKVNLGKELDEIEELRIIGIAMERSMLKFTGGINTQKGAIFLIGMLLHVVAKLVLKETRLSDANIRHELIQLNKSNFNDDFLNSKSKRSHGQKIYKKYGDVIGGGIRKELAEGLPIVFEHALPILRAKKNSDFLDNEKTATPILTRCLLEIISVNNDSNVLYRSDLETLNKLKGSASVCLKNSEGFDSNYRKLCKFCIQKNISPGGSADLLAASIFIYQLQYIN